jgi:NAD(P)-dependent dehydrogenase (short-subunit alcohol dehydrogenase family)
VQSRKSLSSPARRTVSAKPRAYRERNFCAVANSRSIRPSSDPDILAVAGDISDSITAERIVTQALERFGRVDTLVNNAGIFIGKPFAEYTIKDYTSMLAINLNGFFHITKRAAGGIRAHRADHEQSRRECE